MGMGTNVGLASEVPAGNEDLHTGSQTCRKCRSDFETRLFMPTQERTRYPFPKGLLRDTHGRAVSMVALISARRYAKSSPDIGSSNPPKNPEHDVVIPTVPRRHLRLRELPRSPRLCSWSVAEA